MLAGEPASSDLRLRETDLRQLLSRSADHAAARLAAAQVTCRIDGCRTGCVDPDRIRQAVDNLLGNALRFAPAGSVIVISARENGPDLSIEVRYAGRGFPADFLPHAFERFRRPDTSRSRDSGGAGLGLAIVQAIAVAHGGTAAARNGPGWAPGSACGCQAPPATPSSPGAAPSRIRACAGTVRPSTGTTPLVVRRCPAGPTALLLEEPRPRRPGTASASIEA